MSLVRKSAAVFFKCLAWSDEQVLPSHVSTWSNFQAYVTLKGVSWFVLHPRTSPPSCCWSFECSAKIKPNFWRNVLSERKLLPLLGYDWLLKELCGHENLLTSLNEECIQLGYVLFVLMANLVFFLNVAFVIAHYFFLVMWAATSAVSISFQGNNAKLKPDVDKRS